MLTEDSFTCYLSAKVWRLGVIDGISGQGKAPYGVGQHCFLDSIALMFCAEDIAQVQDLQPLIDACRGLQVSDQPSELTLEVWFTEDSCL